MLFGEEDARKMLWRFGDRCQFVDAANDLIAERRLAWPGARLLHLTHAFHRTWVNGSCIIIDQQCALKEAPGCGPMSKSRSPRGSSRRHRFHLETIRWLELHSDAGIERRLGAGAVAHGNGAQGG